MLLAVLQLDGEAYGVPVLELIAERTGRRPARGAVYVALERLVRKGLLASRQGEPTPVRGGRAKRFFTVTATGRESLRSTLDGLRSMERGAEALLAGGGRQGRQK